MLCLFVLQVAKKDGNMYPLTKCFFLTLLLFFKFLNLFSLYILVYCFFYVLIFFYFFFFHS